MGANETLQHNEGDNPRFGEDLSYFSVLRNALRSTRPWRLQFGGQALNITIAGERGILTPTLTGAQPSLYTVNGKTVRPFDRKATRRSPCATLSMKASASNRLLIYRLADLVLGRDYGRKLAAK